MKEKQLSSLIVPLARRFWLLVTAFAVLTGILIYGTGRLRIENDIMFMLPDENDAKTFFLDAQEKFGSSTGVVIAIETEKGIYDKDLLQRIKTAGDLISRANQQIPANSIKKLVPLGDTQALVLTSYLQNRSKEEGKAFKLDASSLSDRSSLAEALSESLPSYLSSGDTELLVSETAEAVSSAIKKDPGLAEKLAAAVTAPTDKRGFNRGVWVDQISSLMETDTVWPEFDGFENIDAFFKGRGFEDVSSSRIFSSLLLERGITDPTSIAKFIFSQRNEIVAAGSTNGFYTNLANAISLDSGENFARELSETIQKAQKQIRTGRLFQPDENALASLKQRLNSWSIFKGTLFSEDEKSTLVLVKTAPNLDKANKALLLDEIRRILGSVFKDSGFKYHIAGEPVVDDEIGELMVKDIRSLFPVVTLIVMASLFIMFRNLPGVFYPLLTVMISLIWCAGSMGYADAPVSVVASALPVLLVAVGTAYAIHLTHSFQHYDETGCSQIQKAERILDLSGKGVMMAGLTTVAGFASLATNKIVPLRDFGIFMALGVVFALMITMYLVPSLMIKFGKDKKNQNIKNIDRKADVSPKAYSRIVNAVSSFCFNRPKTVIAAYSIILAISIAGLFMLKVEMNNITFFKKDSPIRIADTFVNSTFAGTVGFSVVMTGQKSGDAIDPQIVSVIGELSDRLIKENPEIGKVISIADLIKKMNQAFFYNDPAYYRLPVIKDLSGEKSHAALQSQYEAYMDKYQKKDTKNLIDNEKKETVVAVQMRTSSSSVVERIASSVESILSGPLGKPLRDKGMTFRCTGTGSMYLEANRLVVSGQLWSIVVSVVLVFFVVAWIMRSFIYGFFSLVPLTVTIMINFGIMGFLNIALDVATSITACVAIGIGVDYGIHYLVHYRDFRKQGFDHRAAVLSTAAGSGEAIIFNAVAVAAGFIVLLASAFVPLVNLGILISLTMISSAFAAMTLLPAFLSLVESKLHYTAENTVTKDSQDEEFMSGVEGQVAE